MSEFVCDVCERREPLDCAPDTCFCTSVLFLVCFDLKVAHFAVRGALVGCCAGALVRVCVFVCVKDSGSFCRGAPAPLCSLFQAHPGVSDAAAVQGRMGQLHELLGLYFLCRAL